MSRRISTSAMSRAAGRSASATRPISPSANVTACRPITGAMDALQRPPSPSAGKATPARAKSVQRDSKAAQATGAVSRVWSGVKRGGSGRCMIRKPSPLRGSFSATGGPGGRTMVRMTRSTEQKIIERAVKGDKAAAERLIKAHQASLYAYMLRISGRPDVAEDIVQDAFVRVLTHLDRFDPRYRFSTWLFTIAKRLYVNACQKHKPRYDSEIVDGWRGVDSAPSSPTIDTEVRGNARDALQIALGELSAEQREIILLFHQQDWPIAQIARHMDMPDGTVKSHLHRGRQKMRRLLEATEGHRSTVAEVWA
ncbi:MAG: RNA polymerase sigma factor [Phycisphaeraceae bacterium]|nr:MAG: RNA polymerase sigma factor [Phycisphaeraceae bacterium]